MIEFVQNIIYGFVRCVTRIFYTPTYLRMNRYKCISNIQFKPLALNPYRAKHKAFKKPKISKGYLYVLKSGDQNLFKIGITRRNVQKRIKELQTGNPNKLQLISLIESDYITTLEAHLHRSYGAKHFNGEWFKLSSSEVKALVAQNNKKVNDYMLIKN